MEITKSMIVPVISVVALFVKAVFKIDIPSETQDQAAVVVVGAAALVSAIYGIWKNHKNEVQK